MNNDTQENIENASPINQEPISAEEAEQRTSQQSEQEGNSPISNEEEEILAKQEEPVDGEAENQETSIQQQNSDPKIAKDTISEPIPEPLPALTEEPTSQPLQKDQNLSISTKPQVQAEVPKQKTETELKKEAQRAGKTKISLLNYNLFLRPPLIKTKISKDYRRLRFECIANRISPYHILNFQEIFGTLTRKRGQMISIGHQNGYKYMSVPSKKPLFSKYIMDSGLLTLSKLKVAKSDFTQFKFHSGKDRYVYKGVLCSKILLGDTEFDYIKQSQNPALDGQRRLSKIGIAEIETEAEEEKTQDLEGEDSGTNGFVNEQQLNEAVDIKGESLQLTSSISQPLVQEATKVPSSNKVGKKYVYLFNVQSQANYSPMYSPKNHKIYEARLNQIIVLRSTIDLFLKRHSTLQQDKHRFNSVILVAGNIYSDSRGKPIPTNFKLHNKSAEDWLKAQGPTTTEYEFLVHMLSGLGKDIVIDCLQEANGGKNLVTYGDAEERTFTKVLKNGVEMKEKFSFTQTAEELKRKYVTYERVKTDTFENEIRQDSIETDQIEVVEEKKMVPVDSQLTEKDDQMSQQCIDFVFQIIPEGYLEQKMDFECRLNKFKMQNSDVTQLSNHYAIELDFWV